MSVTTTAKSRRRPALAVVAALVFCCGLPLSMSSAAAAGNCGHGPGSECTNNGSHIVVSPFKGLVNGQMVTVRGTGFIPNGGIDAEMCAAVVHSQKACDINTAQTGPPANASGAFFGFKFKVTKVITIGTGRTITCNSTGNCSIGVIAAADINSSNPHSANEDIGFK